MICPATVNNIIPGDYRIIISLDGWSTSNNFKVDYSSREIFPVGWCKLAGIRIAKVGGHRMYLFYFETQRENNVFFKLLLEHQTNQSRSLQLNKMEITDNSNQKIKKTIFHHHQMNHSIHHQQWMKRIII